MLLYFFYFRVSNFDFLILIIIHPSIHLGQELIFFNFYNRKNFMFLESYFSSPTSVWKLYLSLPWVKLLNQKTRQRMRKSETSQPVQKLYDIKLNEIDICISIKRYRRKNGKQRNMRRVKREVNHF